MQIITNVFRRTDVSPIENCSGQTVGYFKKESGKSFSLYLENILSTDLFLAIKCEEEIITNVILSPRETANIVFTKGELKNFRTTSVIGCLSF